MKSSELRMGNLVLCNTSIGFVNTIVSVCNLSSDEIVCSYKPTKQFIFCKDALFEPIPLTEGWLLDFGFDKHENCRDSLMQMYYNNFRLKLNNYNEISFSIYNGDVNVSRCNYNKKDYKIRFVHQLQNLYFALTGEELK
jgi:hypothetical protein